MLVASADVVGYGWRGQHVEVLGIVTGQSVVEDGHPGGRDLDVGRVQLVDLRALGGLGLQPDAVVLQPGLHYLSARLDFQIRSARLRLTSPGHGFTYPITLVARRRAMVLSL